MFHLSNFLLLVAFLIKVFVLSIMLHADNYGQECMNLISISALELLIWYMVEFLLI